MKNKAEKVKEATEWYLENQKTFELLGKEVKEIIEYELKDKGIFYNSIESRVKELESYKEKCKKEQYKEPVDEIMDMTGIRITAFTNADVKSICKIIEGAFCIDKDNYSDKSKEIDVNEFGYLSVHYIAALTPQYLNINKYMKYKDLSFEIQVRTLLQHAWSEIEHDRNYKFKGTLPKELRRRFYMIAGVLEMVDREFESLTNDIKQYTKDVNFHVEKGNLDIELTDVSIAEFIKKEYTNIEFDYELDGYIFDELNAFGLKSVMNLKTLIESLEKSHLNKLLSIDDSEVPLLGFLRDVMIINNTEKYFEIWGNSWDVDQEEIKYFNNFGVDVKKYYKS